MATKVAPPYITAIRAAPDSKGSLFEGMFAEIFDSLRELMNFTYSLKEPPDGEWGAQRADLSWTGMIGMLETKSVDVGATQSLKLTCAGFTPEMGRNQGTASQAHHLGRRLAMFGCF